MAVGVMGVHTRLCPLPTKSPQSGSWD